VTTTHTHTSTATYKRQATCQSSSSSVYHYPGVMMVLVVVLVDAGEGEARCCVRALMVAPFAQGARSSQAEGGGSVNEYMNNQAGGRAMPGSTAKGSCLGASGPELAAASTQRQQTRSDLPVRRQSGCRADKRNAVRRLLELGRDKSGAQKSNRHEVGGLRLGCQYCYVGGHMFVLW